MGEPYVGEIRMFAGNFAPVGWMFCEGQTMPISENEVLFQLIGTTYGGDGEETFNLPNLASRVPMHMGTGLDGITYQIGEMSGTESVTLNAQQVPTHNHALVCSTAPGAVNSVGNQVIAASPSVLLFIQDTPDSTLSTANSVTPQGGNQPHENCQPFLCINFIISLYGVFPSPT
jgi:microcystin-dependent protein